MNKHDKIYIAGHNGLVGSAITRKLHSDGYDNIITRTHKELDLIDQASVERFFSEHKPDYVFLAAAKVGGIEANSIYPADFIYQNTMIGYNIVNAAYNSGVKKLLNLGSTCIYPKMSEQPIKEEALLTGSLEPTNDAYALAKISMIKLCTAYNKQYGTNFLSVMPTNLYGIGDNYNLETSHVLPAMIRKFHEAKISNINKVVLWGDGTPLREFLYSDDLAAAVVYLMEHHDAVDLRNDAGDFINVGSGKELTIKQLAEIVLSIIYEKELHESGKSHDNVCHITWDKTKPNGTPRKICDISRLKALGFTARTELVDGIRIAYKDFINRNGKNNLS
jgi:GDP-L-fucose synthase